MSNANRLKYMAIYKHFRNLIQSGILPADSKLPTEKTIATQFDVSRITVIRGLKQLQDEQLIYRVQGSGSYVKGRDIQENGGLKVISLITSVKGEGREIFLIRGIENRLQQAGYLLSVSNSHEDKEIERRLISDIKDKVQGLIIYPYNSIDNLDIYHELLKEHKPVVYVDKYPMSLPCSYVSCDNFDGGYKIGNYFLEHGHTRFALIYHDIVGFTSERDRYNGFIKAIGEGDIPSDNLKIISIEGDENSETIRRVITELYTGNISEQEKPTAIFTFNDHLALMMMDFISEHKEYNLPSNFLLAGFDDLTNVERGVPFITVHQNYQAIGEQVADVMLAKLESNSLVNVQNEIPVELVYYNI